MARTQTQSAQTEVILAKYLTESIREINKTIRSVRTGSMGRGLWAHPRHSLSAPRLEPRQDGRRAATEVLLPRKLPASHAPAAAAAAAAGRRDDPGSLGGGGTHRSAGQVAATQARLQQLPHGQSYGGGAGPHRSGGGAGEAGLRSSVGGTAPPLPPRPSGVVRTAAAVQQPQHQQQQHQPHEAAGGGVRSAPMPRLAEQATAPAAAVAAVGANHLTHAALQQRVQQHRQHQQQQQQQQQQHQTQSEARIPAVAAAAAAGRGRGQSDGRSLASVGRGGRGTPSDAGTNSSWWQRPGTDVSYPLTAVSVRHGAAAVPAGCPACITDRYAQSMSPTELVKWNERVARLEAEIVEEKERRRQFEEQLKKMVVGGNTGPGAAAAVQAAMAAAIAQHRAGATAARGGAGTAPFR
ncbi:hypothetical protein TSOC_010797 [Tetrabaena socialis]|uniref:Uncharacterized protein n=1 Tax=Tetrabaena socialis TaxID=47790 RepID=A0A2J7ZSC1_9CHLO|nr:hypothetical protein TSOC_010797 [Tetrabaena socialis]|eukprot:PNH03165.1 hypothetical protein TSOC_010797 [Tetrabaena socialis]